MCTVCGYGCTHSFKSELITGANGVGLRKYTCTLCGYSYTEKIPVSGGGGVSTDPSPSEAPKLSTDEHVNYLVGYSDGTIRPNANITRAEAATIIFRLLTDDSRDRYMTTVSSFSDVSTDAWYSTAVATLSRAGIISGYSDGTFRPNAKITRAETVAIINRVLGRGVESAEQLAAGMNTWSDNLDTTAWYYLHIQEASNNHSYERSSGVESWSAKLADIDWEKYNY